MRLGLWDFDWGPDGGMVLARMRLGRGQESVVLVELNVDVLGAKTPRFPAGAVLVDGVLGQGFRFFLC